MRRKRHRIDEQLLEQLLANAANRVPPPTEDDLRNLARAAVAVPRTPASVGDGRRPLYVRWAVAMSVSAVLVGGFGFGLGSWRTPSGVAGTSVVGVGFLPAKGWTVVQSGPRAIAANVPLDPDDDLRDAPYATLESLPAGGVLISTTFGIRGDLGEDVEFPVSGQPLRIAAAEPIAPSLDPLPLQRSLGRYRLRAGVGRYNVDALIYFGTGSPSAAQLAVAQTQLNRLVVASERVTIFARPTILGRGQRLTLLGSVDSDKAEEAVTIEAKDCGQTSFRGIAAVRTREGGGWSTDFVNAGITASFRAVWNNNTSTPVTVQATPWVQLRRRYGSANSFKVAVGARLQFWHRHVVIERFERRLGTWKAVKKVVLTETASTPGYPQITSFETFRVSVPKGTLIRAAFPLSQARPCYLAGYSNQLQT